MLRPELTLIEALLDAGARAPSYNNRQPWRVTLRGTDAFDLQVDRTRLPPYDDVGITGAIALGAFLVNVEIAAQAHGASIEVELTDDGGRVTVQEHGGAGDEDAAALLDLVYARETNRLLDESSPLDDEERDALRDAAAADGCHLTFVSDVEARERLALILGRGASAIPYSRALHAESLGGVRFTRRAARETRDGIDLATMHAAPAAFDTLRQIQDYDRLIALAPGDALTSRSVAERTNVIPFKSASVVCCLEADAPLTPEGMLMAGRSVQQVWLQANALGLGFQPASALTMLSAQPRAHLERVLADGELPRLEELREELRAVLGTPAERVPFFAFRLHRSPRTPARSLRRRLSSFVVGELPRHSVSRAAPRPLLVVETADVKARHDVMGRPLGEQAAPPDAHVGVVTEHRKCPYPGVRHNHERPMNITALKQMTEHWHEMRAGLSFVRAAALARDPAPVSYRQLWRAGQMGALWASFCANASDSPWRSAPLPVLPALTYKILIGINAVVQSLHFDEKLAQLSDDPSDTPAVSAAVVHGFSEDRAVLVGPKEVCAGPPGMIDEVLRLFVEGTNVVEDARALVAPALLDEERLIRFSWAHMDHALARFLYLAGRAAITRDLETWSQIPGGLDSEPNAAALRERIATLSANSRSERVGVFMQELDLEDRETFVEHFAQDLSVPELIEPFVSLWRRPDASVYAEVQRLVSGGPGSRELVAAVTRTLLLEQALLRVIERCEAELAEVLKVPLPTGALDERVLTGPQDLGQLARELGGIDAVVEPGEIRISERS